MTETKPCQITVKNGLTIPSMYGDYSSHQVHVEVSIPATQKEVDEELTEICDKYLELSSPFLRDTINEICASQGKEHFFKSTEDTITTTPEVNL